LRANAGSLHNNWLNGLVVTWSGHRWVGKVVWLLSCWVGVSFLSGGRESKVLVLDFLVSVSVSVAVLLLEFSLEFLDFLLQFGYFVF